MDFNVISYRVSKLFFFTKHEVYDADVLKSGFFSFELKKYDFIDTQRNYQLEVVIERHDINHSFFCNGLPYRFVLRFRRNNSIFKTVVKSKFFGYNDQNLEIFNDAFKQILTKVKYDINNLPNGVKK